MIITKDVVINKIEEASENVHKLSLEYLFDGVHTIIDSKQVFLMQSMPKNDYMIILRDSIQYKFRSIIFHRDIFEKVLSSFNKQIQKNNNWNKPNDFLYACSDQAMFLVDDIIIHIMSLFDYIGNLIGFIFYGDNRRKLQWKGVTRCCKNDKWELSNTGRTKIKKSLVSRKVIDIEKSLVSKLEFYRADLIHYRYHLPGGNMSINLIDSESSKIVLYAPKIFQKLIKEISTDNIDEKIKLDLSIDILLEKTATDINNLINDLRIDLNKIIKIIP